MPQQYTAEDANGKKVTFEWQGDQPPTEAELDEVFAEAAQSAAPARTWTDTAVDAIPSAGGMIGGLLGAAGGPVPAIALAGLGGAAGEGARRIIQGIRQREDLPDTPTEALGGMAMEGGKQAAMESLGPILQVAARVPMRMALGAQKSVRNRFPGVSLEGVALREGVGATNAAKAAALSKGATDGLKAAGRAADAAGAARVQPREIVGPLRPLYDRAVQARMPEQAQEIAEAAKTIGRNYRGGINVEDALVAKTEWQNLGRNALPGGANPRQAGFGPKTNAAISRGLAGAVRGRSPEVAGALTRSQELMALSKATRNAADTTPLLRTIMGASAGAIAGTGTGDAQTGVGTGLLALLLTNPRALSMAAHTLNRAAPLAPQAARAVSLVSSHD